MLNYKHLTDPSLGRHLKRCRKISANGLFKERLLRWEIIKENKKVRKHEKRKKRTRPRKRSRKKENKEENKNSTKKVIKKKRKFFFSLFS